MTLTDFINEIKANPTKFQICFQLIEEMESSSNKTRVVSRKINNKKIEKKLIYNYKKNCRF